MSALPDITRNYHKDNFNSSQANKAVQPKKRPMREQIIAYLDACGPRGATTHEICKALNLKWQTGSARVSELCATHTIYWNGMKRSTDGSQPANCFTTSKGQLGLWERR